MNDIVYKSVSNYYKNCGLDKETFVRRLKYVKNITNKEMTYKDAVDWIMTHEYTELLCESEQSIKDKKKQLRKELKEIVTEVKNHIKRLA